MIRIALAAALAALAGGSAAADGSARSVATAVVRALPARLHDGSAVPIVAEADCRLFLARSDGEELVLPCDSSQPVPAAEYRAWIEQRNAISTPPRLLSLSQGSEETLTLPLVPAGRVRVSGAPPGATVQLMQVTAAASPLFVRRAAPNEPVRMPAGQAVAVAFDGTGVVLLARPRSVTAAREVELALETPRAAAVAAAYETASGDDSAALVLHAGGRSVAPDVLARGSDALWAIWYGAEGGPARLTVSSAALFAREQELVLREGRVTTVRGALHPLPSLEVAIGTVNGAELPPMRLTVKRAGGEIVKEQEIAPGAAVTLERMPAELLTAMLQIGPWSLRREADLSDGRDAAVVFDLDPMLIDGRVRHGGDAARATVTFRIDGESLPVKTDDEGRYSIVLWRRGFYSVDVGLDQRGGAPPYREMLRLSATRTLDLDVPRTSIALRVVDDATSEAIEGARVTLVSSWSERGATQRKTQDVMTPASGEVELPPLREGVVELHVMAEGYEHASHPPLQVAQSSPARVEMRLRRLRADTTLSITLPSGAPAAGAELIALANDAELRVIWRGVADATGSILLPASADGALLLARHSAAASAARIWRKHEPRLEWRLGAAAPPLSVQVTAARQASGRPAELVLWLDGLRLHGIALAFVTRSLAITGANGRVILMGLPAAPTRLLAFRGNVAQQVAAGAFDAVATVVPFPWPAAAVTLDAID